MKFRIKDVTIDFQDEYGLYDDDDRKAAKKRILKDVWEVETPDDLKKEIRFTTGWWIQEIEYEELPDNYEP
jgi:hypothetical protein